MSQNRDLQSPLEQLVQLPSVNPLINIKAINNDVVTFNLIKRTKAGFDRLIKDGILETHLGSEQLLGLIFDGCYRLCARRSLLSKRSDRYTVPFTEGDEANFNTVTFPVVENEMHMNFHVSMLHLTAFKNNAMTPETRFILMTLSSTANRIAFGYYTFIFQLNLQINERYVKQEGYKELKKIISQEEFAISVMNQSAEICTYLIVMAFVDNIVRKKTDTHEHLVSLITHIPMQSAKVTRTLYKNKATQTVLVSNTICLANFASFASRITMLFACFVKANVDDANPLFSFMKTTARWMKGHMVQSTDTKQLHSKIEHHIYWHDGGDERIIELTMWRMFIIDAMSAAAVYSVDDFDSNAFDFLARILSMNFNIHSSLMNLDTLKPGGVNPILNSKVSKYRALYLYLKDAKYNLVNQPSESYHYLYLCRSENDSLVRSFVLTVDTDTPHNDVPLNNFAKTVKDKPFSILDNIGEGENDDDELADKFLQS